MNTVIDFSNFKNKINSDIHSTEHKWIYRGQSNKNWNLETSLYRFCKIHDIKFNLIEYLKIIDEFVEKFSLFSEKNILGIEMDEKMALAQHFGLPTPLLDWTYSPYIAVFFALIERLNNPSSEPFTIWAIDAGQLKNGKLKIKSEKEDEIFFIETKLFNTKRLDRQLGCFTFIGRDCNLEEILKENARFNGIKRYDIECKNWSSIIHELRLMGISTNMLYDNLDGIAKDVILKRLFTKFLHSS